MRLRSFYGVITIFISLLFMLCQIDRSPSAAQVTSTSPPPPYLGLLTRNNEKGIEVVEILPNSPADRAGLKIGDLVVSINGVAVLPDQPLGRQIGGLKLGIPATFVVRRGNTEQTVTIIPGERPTATPTPRPSATPDVKPGGAYIGFGLVEALDGSGAQIEKIVDGAPAAQVGLRKGDIITAIDDQKITSSGQVQALLSGKAPGQIIRVTVLRDKQLLQFTVTLGSANPSATSASTPLSVTPTPGATLASAPTLDSPINGTAVFVSRVSLGITFEVVNEAVAKAKNLNVTYGALVIEVQKGSIAEAAGIQPGDVITEVEGDKVDAKRTLPLRMLPYVPGDVITLTIVRGKETLKVTVTLTARGSA
jgi:S1-C subfamily serine protease